MATNLLSVILVTSGSRGDKLLFCYPVEEVKRPKRRKAPVSSSLYSVRPNVESQSDTSNSSISNPLHSYTYSVLANLLAPKNALCGQAFELTVDNMVFVGQPTQATYKPRRRPPQPGKAAEPPTETTFMFNIVFVLHQSSCCRSVIDAYYDLSRRLAIGLAHEEKRCNYLGKQAQNIVSLQEELATERAMEPEEVDPVLMFSEVLKMSTVAQDLREGFESLHKTGTLRVLVNRHIDVSFCLPTDSLPPHILSSLPSTTVQVRPYHACLLLDEVSALEGGLPDDHSRPLLRLIRSCTPVKSMLTLSHDTDQPLTQVFNLVTHLVYWRQATVIYPLCESNVYILSPNATLGKVSALALDFISEFGEVSLAAVLSYFSLPTPLGQKHLPSGLVKDIVRTVVWLLQHGLLSQVHTYVLLLPSAFQTLSPVADQDADLLVTVAMAAANLASGHSTPEVENKPLLGAGAGVSSVGGVGGVGGGVGGGGLQPGRSPRHARHLSIASNSTDRDHDSSTESIIHELRKHLTETELAAVLDVDASQNSEDLELFAKLCPYFRGKQHLEEMMYYENVTRSQLLTLLDKYSGVLVTAVHEDAAIAGDGS